MPSPSSSPSPVLPGPHAPPPRRPRRRSQSVSIPLTAASSSSSSCSSSSSSSASSASASPLPISSTSSASSSSTPPQLTFSFSPATSPFPDGDDNDPYRYPVPVADATAPRTRLEVLSAWEVNFSVLSQYLATLFALLYLCVTVFHFRSSWPHGYGLVLQPPTSPWMSALATTLNFAATALALYFAAALCAAPLVTDEQIWTAVLLCVVIVVPNPLTRDDVALTHPRYIVVADALYSSVMYLYVILMVHSYSYVDTHNHHHHSAVVSSPHALLNVNVNANILHNNQRTTTAGAGRRKALFHSPRFYGPKIAAALVYFSISLFIGLRLHISLGLIPSSRILTTFTALLFLPDSNPQSFSSFVLLASVSVVFLFDFLLAYHIVARVARTAELLARVPYVENRAKQLGFRCFVYQTFAFCSCLLLLSVVTLSLLPRSYIAYLVNDHPSHFAFLDPPVAHLALAFVYFAWSLVLALVNLPPAPLLTNAGRKIVHRLAPLARNRLAVWLGFADHVATEDAEDDPDENENVQQQLQRNLNNDVEDQDQTIAISATEYSDNCNVNDDNSNNSHRDNDDHDDNGDVDGEETRQKHSANANHACKSNGLHLISTAASPAAAAETHLRPHQPQQPQQQIGYGAGYGAVSHTPTPTLPHALRATNNFASTDSENGPVVVPPKRSVPLQYRHRELFDLVPDAKTIFVMKKLHYPAHHYYNNNSNRSAYVSPLSLTSSYPPNELSHLLAPAHADPNEMSKRTMSQQQQPSTTILAPSDTQLSCITSPHPRTISHEHGHGNHRVKKSITFACFDADDEKEKEGRAYGDNDTNNEINNRNRDRDKADRKRHRLCLRSRKNLFVMETQILMANAAYLSYIFGNPREELVSPGRRPSSSPSPCAPFHLSDSGSGNVNGMQGNNNVDVRDNDDGSFFRVDPYVLAQRHGLSVYRYIACKQLNTHVVILANDTRVVVTFSGTRDVSHWRVNANFNREVLDQHLSRFEIDLDYGSDDDDHKDKGVQCRHVPTPSFIKRSKSEDVLSCARNKQSRTRSFHSGNHPDGKKGSGDSTGESNGNSNGNGKQRPTSMRNNRSVTHIPAAATASMARPTSWTALTCREQQQSPASYSSTATTANNLSTADNTTSTSTSSSTTHVQNDSTIASSNNSSSIQRPNVPDLNNTSSKNAHSQGGGHHPGDSATSSEDMTSIHRLTSALAHELRTFGQAKVHCGFLEAYTSIRKRMLGALFELYQPPSSSSSSSSSLLKRPIFFCGHSLGGAMATLGAYECARYFRRIGIARRQDISCTTFGSPRVGNEAFKMRYQRLVETHWRFEMAADPITQLPGLLNYTHVGVQVLVDQSGMLLIDPSFVEVQWWGRLTNPYLGYKLHIRASYLMALKTYCKRYRTLNERRGGRATTASSMRERDRRGDENEEENEEEDLTDRFWPFPLRFQTKGLFKMLEEADEQGVRAREMSSVCDVV